MEPELKADLVARLRGSRKYGEVCEDTLTRIVDWASIRHRKTDQVLKASRRKLHQVYGAYFDRLDKSRLRLAVESLVDGAPQEAIRRTCSEILRLHSSTEERIEIVEEIYRDVFNQTGIPRSVADLACGLNPFALPWMGLPQDTSYRASDIDHGVVDATDRLLAALGQKGAAECRDVLVTPPTDQPDVTLLLKTAPCLEQQERGSFARLLRHIRSPFVVVSFPTRSLGGRQKGMTDSYGRFMDGVAADLEIEMSKLEYPSEVVYIVRLDADQL